ncbi:MAG: hypothetical protein U0802_08545 [Candidatus Binatia bacterium]
MSAAAEGALHAAATLAVTLKDGELSVPVPGSYPIVVGLPQLLVIEALATAAPVPVAPIVRDVARRTGVAEAELAASVQRLRDLGYLLPTPARSAPRRAPAAAAATAPGLSGKTIVVPTPCSALVADAAFALWDHAGRRCVRLDAVELFALRALTEPRSLAAAHGAHRALAGGAALSEAAFAQLVARLCAAGFAVLADDRPAAQIFGNDGTLAATLADQSRRLRDVFARRAAEQDALEAARVARGGRPRPRVVPVAFDACPPLALGLITAYAKVYRDGVLDDAYELRSEWMWLEDRLADNTARPAIYLFSNYLWSHAQCMQVSEQVKRLSPHSITIHGGPDTPKYPGDVEAYFRDHPSVDVTVRGEGEATAVAVLDALRAVIGQERPDLCCSPTCPASPTATATASCAPRTASASPTSTPSRRRSSPGCSTPTARCRARSRS